MATVRENYEVTYTLRLSQEELNSIILALDKNSKNNIKELAIKEGVNYCNLSDLYFELLNYLK